MLRVKIMGVNSQRNDDEISHEGEVSKNGGSFRVTKFLRGGRASVKNVIKRLNFFLINIISEY